MNEIRKEKLRITNLVDAINETGVMSLSLEFGRPGSVPVSVTKWHTDPHAIDEIYQIFSRNMLSDIQMLRTDMEALLLECHEADVEEVA